MMKTTTCPDDYDVPRSLSSTKTTLPSILNQPLPPISSQRQLQSNQPTIHQYQNLIKSSELIDNNDNDDDIDAIKMANKKLDNH